ncbi:unnamed protein product [Clonostachys rosea]|uniref:DUF3176 domain containing protein n=1 Tax=Bionectria ochroleuca TaxID=29856 RepID=A0ABY6UCI3_BIOOC|nr:unnamed protein product [Clonostachys rosea]
MASINQQGQDIPTSKRKSTDLSLPSLNSPPHLTDHPTSLDESAPAPGLPDTSTASPNETTSVADNAHQETKSPSNELGSMGPQDDHIVSGFVRKRKGFKSLGFYPTCKVWLLEIVSIMLGVLMLLAIVMAFIQLNHKSLPNWPLAITLNTLVAFLAITSKAALLTPVSVAISQAQWGWFQKERPLYDLHTFDQASRGAWGSLLFLKRFSFKHFSSIGAFLMVISLFTSPITQLAISYPVRSIAVQGEATVGTVNSIFASRDTIEISSVRAILLSIASDTNQFSNPIQPEGASCFTGNCTFDTYASLGVCLKTANITSQLHIEQLNDNESTGFKFYDTKPIHDYLYLGAVGKLWKASLPGGSALVSYNGFASVTATLNGNETIGFPNSGDLLRTRIVSLVLIFTKPVMRYDPFENKTMVQPETVMKAIDGMQFEALEFLFHLCVQTYNTTVRMGKESTQIEQSVFEPLSNETGAFMDLDCNSFLTNTDHLLDCDRKTPRYNDTMYLKAPVINSKEPSTSVSEKKFGIDYVSMENIAVIIANSLRGYSVWSYNPTNKYARLFIAGMLFPYYLHSEALFSIASSTNASERDNRVSNIFTNVATVISSKMRTPSIGVVSEHVLNFTGQAWRDETYVHINWGWISFLAVENALAAGFVFLTILSQSKRQRIHEGRDPLIYEDAKDSSLATLVALGGQCRQRMGGGLRPINELEKAAKDLRVRLDTQELVPAESS